MANKIYTRQIILHLTLPSWFNTKREWPCQLLIDLIFSVFWSYISHNIFWSVVISVIIYLHTCSHNSMYVNLWQEFSKKWPLCKAGKIFDIVKRLHNHDHTKAANIKGDNCFHRHRSMRNIFDENLIESVCTSVIVIRDLITRYWFLV